MTKNAEVVILREKICFDGGWLFHDGDIKRDLPPSKGAIYTSGKAEDEKWGPASIYYPDKTDSYANNELLICEKWDSVTLPHDYMIEKVPDKAENPSLGFVKYTNGWYRKHFYLSEGDFKKRLVLSFDGISASFVRIYFNGSEIYHAFSANSPFEVDITDYAKFLPSDCTDKKKYENVLAVYVNTDKHEGWWYEGGGITRHVFLIKTDFVSVDTYGVYIKPQRLEDGRWHIEVETTVRNDTGSTARVEVSHRLSGLVAGKSDEVEVQSFSKAVTVCGFDIESPILWDIDNPHLYCLETEVMGENISDKVENTFGLRTIRFDCKEGFFLNGRHVKIKGVNCHFDFGLTGRAFPDSIQKYRIKLLREMGANAFRAAHYPHSEETMDELDRVGMLVLDEVRRFSSSVESLANLETLIKRDRNHPSVILWSVGNEEHLFGEDRGGRIFTKMASVVKRLDSTRPVTVALDKNLETAKTSPLVDVIGVNYNYHLIDKVHELNPTKPMLMTECCAVGTSRGWYDDDYPPLGRLSAFDHGVSCFTYNRESVNEFIMSRKWLCGGFQWAGVEHRGEAAWPRLCSVSGALDLFLMKKEAFYQNLSHWSEKPVIHIVCGTNFAEGEKIRIVVYTNCEKIELFEGEKSLGIQEVPKLSHGEYTTEYSGKVLRAVGYSDGKESCSDTKHPSGKGEHLGLSLLSDGDDGYLLLDCVLYDKDSHEATVESPVVEFSCSSNAVLCATGSDNTDHVIPSSAVRKMHYGHIAVLLKRTGEGKIKVRARSDNFNDCVTEF